MRFAWVGFHMEGQAALEALLQDDWRPAAVITLEPDAAAKRSAALDYRILARKWGVPIHLTRNINDPETVQFLKSLNLDVVFVIGWSQIVGPDALDTARVGMIGAHASKLPRLRGSAPVNWAVLRGEPETGNTLLWLADEVDAGDVIDQRTIPISRYDTCQTIYKKVADSNREMLLNLLPRLAAGERPGYRQMATDEPLLPRRRPADGLIDWTLTNRQIYDSVRALTRPYPGAFGYIRGDRWTVWNSACLARTASTATSPAGCIVGSSFGPHEQSCGLIVQCGEGDLLLLELEDEQGVILQGYALSERNWLGEVWTDGP